MTPLDFAVLGSYFALVTGIGLTSLRRIKTQDDYFLGGRGFGKLLQTFAAFGAGTGSGDPVNAARTVFTGGASGMWSVMYWLFMTPFYWITAVWYRRMRHTTLGDWFVERYESPRLGAAYAVFGVVFFLVFTSMLLSAIGKVATPIVGVEAVSLAGYEAPLEYVLVPSIGAVVLIYGLAGGLHAAYLTDLAQGVCIIFLSVMLIPFGLRALASTEQTGGDVSLFDGFTVLHERLPESAFALVGAEGSEFTGPFLAVVVVLNLVGVVVQPHFIATGGGSAKTEFDARVGLVLGNLLKRLCTVGWVLVGLIALALYSDDPLLLEDPDKTWGVISQRLLPSGLTGLMLACLLAALMSSVDAYMITGSALVVRNIYREFYDRDASEQRYLLVARLTGCVIVVGAIVMSLLMMDVFGQLQLTWAIPILFAAPFWMGMYWRGATTAGAWATVVFGLVVFFVMPLIVPGFTLSGALGLPLSEYSSAGMATLSLAEKIVSPFLVMTVVSLLTTKNSKAVLDRYYKKMQTPVDPDPAIDRRNLESALDDSTTGRAKKLFPGSSIEINQPTKTDIVGFLAMIACCGFVIWLAHAVINYGGPN
jgi:SSS family solute:Na+ symporter